ncbi:MAG: acyl-CoA dehydrogenase [Catenulispora sp.]
MARDAFPGIHSEEQSELRKVVCAFLEKHSDQTEVRRLMATDEGFDRALWRRMGGELGLQGLVIPEEFGGAGFGHVEVGLVFEEMGRALLCAPYFATVALAVEALLRSGDAVACADLLPGIAQGETVATLAIGSGVPGRAATSRAQYGADGWKVSGVEQYVLDGHVADLILLVAETDAGPTLFAVAAGAAGLDRELLPTQDQTRKQARLTFADTPARLVGARGAAGPVLERTLAAAAVLLAAEQVGAASKCLEMAVDYAKLRTQYGRPIGSFQGVKHLCADMAVDLEAARSAVYDALWSLDAESEDVSVSAAIAGVFCTESFTRIAGDCIQIHGGIGFTWEHPAHLYFKRAKGSEVLLGTPAQHRARLSVPSSDSMDLDFGPQVADFRQEVRSWLGEHLVGEFAAHRGVGSPTDAHAWEVRLAWDRELAAGGWLGISWPKEYGGRGLGLLEEIVFSYEYAKIGAPYRASVNGLDLLGPMLLAMGSPEQKARFLPRILAVQDLWGQGFSEPGAGSDLASVSTRAVLEADEWVIDGQKVWSTMAQAADWLYVLARTDPDSRRHRGLSMLLVPTDQPGVEIRPIRNLAGQEEFAEVFFTGARTAADLVVGEVGQGWRTAMGTLGIERGATLLPQQLTFEREAQDLVAAARALGDGLDAETRSRVVQAWMSVRIMRVTNLRTVGELLSGRVPGRQASTAKLFASQAHQRLGHLAGELAGPAGQIVGPGYELDLRQRSFLLSLAETIYGGTSQIQRNLIGEQVLGLPKDPRPGLDSAR